MTTLRAQRPELDPGDDGWIKSNAGWISSKEYRQMRSDSEGVGFLVALLAGVTVYFLAYWGIWTLFDPPPLETMDPFSALLSIVITAVLAAPTPRIPAWLIYVGVSESILGPRLLRWRQQHGERVDREMRESKERSVATVNLTTGTVTSHR